MGDLLNLVNGNLCLSGIELNIIKSLPKETRRRVFIEMGGYLEDMIYIEDVIYVCCDMIDRLIQPDPAANDNWITKLATK